MVKIIPNDNTPIIVEGIRPAREVKLISNTVDNTLSTEKVKEKEKEKKGRVSKLDRKKIASDEAKQRLYAFIETNPKKKDIREYFIRRLEELSNS